MENLSGFYFSEGRKMSWRVGVAVGAVLALCCVFGNARGLAVMSVDLGSEWMKIGIVSVRFYIVFGILFVGCCTIF